MDKIRTRFAPSPTGWMHIGNLRTAVYAYLLAKSNNGDFIIRIEDTDQKREVAGSKEFIFNTLKSAGLSWDEGPDIGGKYAPYIQSERRAIYAEYAHKLVELDGGYYCFCAEDAEREKGMVDPCRNIPYKDARARVDSGEKFVVRQKIPADGETTYYDVIYGKITFPNKDLDDGVMLKSDGLPTYNFANVVDDHLMEISHVMRGCEYLSSTPKYELLYKTFGWTPPKYVHVTHIMKDAQHKLSKRDGSASFTDLTEKGFLPSAIVNYIILLGWNSKDNQEYFTLDQLIKRFSLKGLQKSPAIFDEAKLRWINSLHIKALSDKDFHDMVFPYYPEELKGNKQIEYLSGVIKNRIEYLAQVTNDVDFLVHMPSYDTSLFLNEKMGSTKEFSIKAISSCIEKLKNIPEENWNDATIKDAMFSIVNELGLKTGQVLWPIRVALSGKQFTPGGGVEIAAVLGKEESIKRLTNSLVNLNS